MLALAGAIVALLVVSTAYPLTSAPGLGLFVAVIAVVCAYAPLVYRNSREYGYGSRGLYRRGRLLFEWGSVQKVSLAFQNKSGSLDVAPLPSLLSVVTGPVVQKEAWVDYGVALVFKLQDGAEARVPSSLDGLTRGRVVEDLTEKAKAANPRISFE